MSRIVCISDTHHRYGQGMSYPELKLPEGDVLVHSGDATMQGSESEVATFNEWLGRQPFRHRIFVPGNHDWIFQNNPKLALSLMTNAKVLIDQGVVLDQDDQLYPWDSEKKMDGIKIYGSPWQPLFYDWAFNLTRGKQLADKWSLIPEGTNLLVTHGPPLHQGDQVTRYQSDFSYQIPIGVENVGCWDLAERIKVIKPTWHQFGHIHVGHGITKDDHTTYINAAICDEQYVHSNLAIVIDTESGVVREEEYVDTFYE